MAPPACESESQAVEESDARGVKKGGPGGSNSTPPGSNFASWGVPNGLLETSHLLGQFRVAFPPLYVKVLSSVSKPFTM